MFTNQYSKNLCNNQIFWNKKYELHNLSKLKYIHKFEEYKKHYKLTDIMTKIRIYDALLKAQIRAYDALDIYDKNPGSIFTIGLSEAELTTAEQRYYIPISLIDVLKLIDNFSFEPHSITINKENNIYKLKYTVLDDDDIVSVEKIISKKLLIDMLTLMLYGNDTFYNFEIKIW